MPGRACALASSTSGATEHRLAGRLLHWSVMDVRTDLRNIAIIAHVDHGKTTLVDAMLWQGGIFRANETVPERVMDSIDLEREKGITIMAKNTAITYRGREAQHRGHARPRRLRGRGRADADPGGRRPAPGGRRRGAPAPDALRPEEGAGGRAPAGRGHQQDRPGRRPAGPGAGRGLRPLHRPRRRRGQLEFPVLYTDARRGTATRTAGRAGPEPGAALRDDPGARSRRPRFDPAMGLQLRAASLDWDDYVGRLVIGRVVERDDPGQRPRGGGPPLGRRSSPPRSRWSTPTRA